MNSIRGQPYKKKGNQKKLGQILLDYGFLSPEQLSFGLKDHQRSGKLLGEALVKNGLISREAWLKALSFQLRMPSIDLRNYSPSEYTIRAIPENICRSYTVIAVDHNGKELAAAMRFPQDGMVVRKIQTEINRSVFPVIGWAEDIEKRLDEIYNSNSTSQHQSSSSPSAVRDPDDFKYLSFEPDPVHLHSRLYLEALKNTMDLLSLELIGQISEILLRAYREERKIFVMGNGGSAATASHFCCDLGKGTVAEGRDRFRVISLTDNIPLMTAWSNDTDYHNVFVEQLANLLQPKDVVIGISGSGNSPNVLHAIEYANSQEAITIGLTGFSGGKIKDMAAVCLVVPSYSMEQIEDVHLVLGHLICTHLRKVVKDDLSLPHTKRFSQ